MARKIRKLTSRPPAPEALDVNTGPDGAWGGADSQRIVEEEVEQESHAAVVARVLDGIGPMLAARLTPTHLVRLVHPRAELSRARRAALVAGLLKMSPGDRGAPRKRALARQALRVAALSPEAAPCEEFKLSAQDALLHVDPADLADAHLPEAIALADAIGATERALALRLEQVAADPNQAAATRRWITEKLQQQGTSAPWAPTAKQALVTLASWPKPEAQA